MTAQSISKQVLVTFYDGNRSSPVQLLLPSDEADRVCLLSSITHRRVSRPGESKSAARIEWEAWFAASPDDEARARRLGVQEAMHLTDEAIAKATGGPQ